tara:strand:+ start:17455 stop:19068 length:1614 start_codon:yes stop_codon:yes gene_type:complete
MNAKKSYLIFSLILIFLIISYQNILAQPKSQDFRYNPTMDIDNVLDIASSPSHLYVLSEQEGLAVFRVSNDNTQWLYTNMGMQRRGNKIVTDIRFAYLFGNGKRLTVLEPTSVLGVYTSTYLPTEPRGIARLRDYVYLALGSEGLGVLGLQNPEAFDSSVTFIAHEVLQKETVLDVLSTPRSQQLLVLSPSKLHNFSWTINEDTLEWVGVTDINPDIIQLHLVENELFGSSEDGELFRISKNGSSQPLTYIGTTIMDIIKYKDTYFIESTEKEIWLLADDKVTLWKNNAGANYHLTGDIDRLWLHEFGALGRVHTVTETSGVSDSSKQESRLDSVSSERLVDSKSLPNTLTLLPYKPKIVPYPNPILFGIQVAEDWPTNAIRYSVKSAPSGMKIKGQGVFWQPQFNQIGIHRLHIIAQSSTGLLDSTFVQIDITSFNNPPRISPVRTNTLIMGDPYKVTYTAMDPEAKYSQESLIRFLGVDLPEGARLDEKSGELSWTPTEKDLGVHRFKVIATDALGAASSVQVELNVIGLPRDNN